MKKVLLRFFLISIIMTILVSVSYATNIHLKNGSVIRGEIISFDDTSVTIKELVWGIMKISREKIIRIEPPLEEKKVKEEKIEAEISKEQEPNYIEFLTEKRGGKLISIYLGGGMSNINGGDLNGAIRDYNMLIKDYNDYHLTDYSADWKEFKWIQNLKGEVLFNLSSSFSIGLGIEYLTKMNKGIITLNDDYSGKVYGSKNYNEYSFKENYSFESKHKLIVIPITVNLYFFIPLGNIAKVFITGGIGYYYGKLKYNEPYQSDSEYKEDYYSNIDDTYLYSWVNDYSLDGTYVYEAKCNEQGYHGGVGFDIKLFSNISLVAEGNYRYVNFKDWDGSGSDKWSWEEKSGWTDSDYNYDSGNEYESWDGKIWYYENNYPDIGKQYAFISLQEEGPEPNRLIKNPRQAEINLNGFSFRAGIRIRF